MSDPAECQCCHQRKATNSYAFWKGCLIDTEKASDLHVPLETVTTTYTYRLLGKKELALCDGCVRAHAMQESMKALLLSLCLTLLISVPSIYYVYIAFREGNTETAMFLLAFFAAIFSPLPPLFAVINGMDYLRSRTGRQSPSEKQLSGYFLAITLDKKLADAGFGGEDGRHHPIVYWSEDEYRKKFPSVQQ